MKNILNFFILFSFQLLGFACFADYAVKSFIINGRSEVDIDLENQKIKIKPTIPIIADRGGVEINILGLGGTFFQGAVDKVDGDMYFIITGTPRDFYFNLVNLHCDNGRLEGSQVFTRRVATRKIIYDGNDIFMRSSNAAPFVQSMAPWLYYKSESASHDPDYICSQEFKDSMAEYHMTENHKTNSSANSPTNSPFQVSFKKGAKITIRWSENWVDPRITRGNEVIARANQILSEPLVQKDNMTEYETVIQNSAQDLKAKVERNILSLKKDLEALTAYYEPIDGPQNLGLIDSQLDRYEVGSMSFIRLFKSAVNSLFTLDDEIKQSGHEGDAREDILSFKINDLNSTLDRYMRYRGVLKSE